MTIQELKSLVVGKIDDVFYNDKKPEKKPHCSVKIELNMKDELKIHVYATSGGLYSEFEFNCNSNSVEAILDQLDYELKYSQKKFKDSIVTINEGE